MNTCALIKSFNVIDHKNNILINILKLCHEFFEYNNIHLVNLNKLNCISNNNFYYWNICKNTGLIYNIKLLFNDITNNNNNNNINQLLHKINRYSYTEIIINLALSDNIKSDNYIKLFDKYYYINSMNINKKTINDIIISNNIISNFDIKNISKKRKLHEDSTNPDGCYNSSSSDEYTINKKIKINNDKAISNNSSITNVYNNMTDYHNINWNNMVTASSIRNYMLDDPLIDYLKQYNILSLDSDKKINNQKNFINNTNYTPNTFTKHILEAGDEFEKELIKIIKNNHNIIKVAEYIHSRDISKFIDTINLMKKGVPIIYQGLLYNLENNTFGLPDLIVRSDYLNTLLQYEVISNEEANIPSPNLNIKFHYKIIDIKHSNIKLKADGIHILNSDSIPAYKGQVYVYTLALNKILGININKAFIWGK